MNQCWFLSMICPATSFATELNPVILLGLSFQPSTEKRKYIINIPEAHQEICKVRSSCPSKLLSSGTEGSDEHEAEPGLALHEPFQIWKKLYCYLSFIQNMLAPLTWIRKILLYHVARSRTISFSCYQKFSNFTHVIGCNQSIKK